MSGGVRANSTRTPASRPVSRIRATKNRSLTTARTGAPPSPAGLGSVVLFTDAEPVLVPLGDVGERGKVAHAIEIDLAVEMVGLVLAHAREEILGDYVDRLALAIEALQTHRGEAGHHPPHVGDRKAPFPALLHLVGQRRDDRIDEDHQRHRRRVRVAGIAEDLDDRDLLECMHLGGREPGAVVLAHRLDHVVDQPLNGRRPERRGIDALRDLAKHGMAETRDFQDRHDSLKFTMRHFVSIFPTFLTPSARRRASASKNFANSSPCLNTIGVSSLSMAPLKSASPTDTRKVSRSLPRTGSGVPRGAKTPAQM